MLLPLLALGALALYLVSKKGSGVSTIDSLLDLRRQVEAYVKGASSFIYVSPIGDGYYLREDAAASWERLRAKASEVPLVVNSAFRTMAEQESLWAQKVQGLISSAVARPGFSNHQNGVALDVQVDRSTSSPQYKWLAVNGPPHGWVNVGASFGEPWHWEYKPELDTYA